MFNRITVQRNSQCGMTTLYLIGDEADVQIRLLSKTSKKERRAFVRSFLIHMRPWIRYFTQAAVTHSGRGIITEKSFERKKIVIDQSRSVASPSGAIGYEIRIARLKLGLSQTEVAKHLGISRSHLSDLERGKYSPNKNTRKIIEQMLQIELRKKSS